MEPRFWHQRWQENLIGFHQSDFSPALIKYSQQLEIAPGDRVFVPLCGKSLDMRWMQQQDYRVVGVELSDIAARDFFKEWSREASVTPVGPFDSYRSGDVEILCGDFFELTPERVAGTRAVFDRAALIALPEALRKQYVSKIADLVDSGVRVLLVTLEYPEQQMSGPPFSVDEAEVRDLYSKEFSITLLNESDVLAAEPKFRERGLTRLVEKTYLLQRH